MTQQSLFHKQDEQERLEAAEREKERRDGFLFTPLAYSVSTAICRPFRQRCYCPLQDMNALSLQYGS